MTRRSSWRRWSLRRRLITGTIAMVLITLLLAGTATVLSLRASLYERLDEDVLTGLDVARGPVDSASDAGVPEGPGPRQRIDTLEVVFTAEGTATSSAHVDSNGDVTTLTPLQLERISTGLDEERTPSTVDLGGALGTFRVASETTEDGFIVVAGQSMRDVTTTITALTVILAIVVAAGLLTVTIGITWLVRVTLRPLNRVADTAERVAQRPLGAGAVTLTERAGLDEDPGTEVGRVGAALDTLLGHVEDALASRQESEDRLRAFIADASHELRTPLASIRGYAQLAQDDARGTTAAQTRSLDRIESEAERMGALVEDLLLLARLDAGHALHHEPVDIALLAIETAEDAHAAYPDHEWPVEVGTSLEVSGDGSRLRQVLVNLLGNAGKHTPAGTRVTTAVTHDAGNAVITVTDDGPGIDPDLRQRLFDRFARGDSARNRASGSTGLGLSIVAAIVQAHHGTVDVASDSGGSTFTVRLPLADQCI